MRTRHLNILTLIILFVASPAFAQDDLRGAFGPGRDGGVGGIHSGRELQRVTIDQTVFPLARCNDNSPAIFYFRPATRQADANKWVINLQGGGSCGSGLSCSERWFSVNTNFGRNNMTSIGFPDRTDENGIFERDAPYGAQNPIDTWNQIFIHYCSSDAWTGTLADETLQGIDFRPLFLDLPILCVIPKDYKISFLGRKIFDAAIKTLRRDGVPSLTYQPVNPLRSPTTMPDLDDAELVLLSGGSGGGAGVIHNLDHLRSMLPAGARLVGLSDSAFKPSKDNMDLSLTSLCQNHATCTVDTQNQWIYNQGAFAIWGEGNGSDASCFSFHTNDPWKCADSHHILVNHVTTPFFVRMDQLDPNALPDYQDDNIFLPNSTSHPISELEFAQAVRADIQALAFLRITAEERVNFTPGAFSAACRQHDVLRSNTDVYGTAIQRGGRQYTMFDLLIDWVRGNGPSLMAGASDGSDSICP